MNVYAVHQGDRILGTQFSECVYAVHWGDSIGNLVQ